MPKKLTKEEFIYKAKRVHGNKYDYSNVVYVNSKTKVIIVCKAHGEFDQFPSDHTFHKAGYPECGIASSASIRTNTKEYFLEKAKQIHGDLYDYSKTVYSNTDTPVIITCLLHGDFEQYPRNHMRGMGCRKCGRLKIIEFNTKDTITFINDAKQIHGDTYDYSLVKYTNSTTPVTITCTTHGEFEQTPISHLNGSNCPQCTKITKIKNLRSTTEEFIERANKIHDYEFDYSLVKYVTNAIPVIIICSNHGEFEQTPGSHLSGSGCSKCSNNVSNSELVWLNSIGVPERQVILNIHGKKFRVDGFDPKTNTVYEFLGDFWHGNPEKYDKDDINCVNYRSFGNLYNDTFKRIETLKQQYNVVYIWESDFKRLKKYFVALL